MKLNDFLRMLDSHTLYQLELYNGKKNTIVLTGPTTDFDRALNHQLSESFDVVDEVSNFYQCEVMHLVVSKSGILKIQIL